MKDRDWQRLARYYAGEVSPEEEAEIRRWIDAEPDRRAMAESLGRVWELSGELPPRHGGDARRAWSIVATGIHAPAPQPSVTPAGVPRTGRSGGSNRPSQVRRTLALVLPIAAVLLLFLIPLLLRPASDRFAEAPQPADAVVSEYVTREAERLRLTLADGSIIELGPNSRLLVPPFEADRREVRLQGIALFEVTPDAERPFLVHAGDAVTRVLGTRFVVRAYSGETVVRVAVLEGSVALASGSAAEETVTVLTDLQLGHLAAGGVARVVHDAREFNQLVRWTSGRLEFTDRPLSEVLAELELWYNVDIVINDRELASRPLSTVVERETLDEVLNVIALVTRSRYERFGDQIIFSSQ